MIPIFGPKHGLCSVSHSGMLRKAIFFSLVVRISDETSFRHCSRSIPCERFVKHSVSTAAVSIITPKRIHPKMPCDRK